MTPRSIRRAAERRANKLARKAAAHALQNNESVSAAPENDLVPENDFLPSHDRQGVDAEAIESAATTQTSDAQLSANRRNAQLSTGPTSSEGKAKVSRNALRTGLSGRTVLLPSDDAAEYERHIQGYYEDFHPVGQVECDLVRAIADAGWRQLRIPALEMALFAKGHLEFAEEFQDVEPQLRCALLDARTFIAYEKQFRNLQIQESRLHRRREKDLAELRRLQQERKAREEQAAASEPATPSQNGFEFPTTKIDGYVDFCSSKTLNSALAASGLSSQQAA